MAKQTVKIFKKDKVNMTGSLQLKHDIRTGRLMSPKGSHPAAPLPTAGVPQQARIIESNTEYAIIEITCSCGAVSNIQCNYSEMTRQ